MQDKRFPELSYLSLYEFFRYWRFGLATYMRSMNEWGNEDHDCYHARSTMAGTDKVIAGNGSNILFHGGTDYVIKEGGGGESWLPFPALWDLDKIRHTWIRVRNERPRIPSFFCKAPMPDRKR